MSESQAKPEVVLNEAAHRFEVREGNHLAVLDYRIAGGNRMALIHTGVPESLEGRGVGSALVQAALEHAHAHQLKVVPLCPFAEAYLRKHPEYSGLIAPERAQQKKPT